MHELLPLVLGAGVMLAWRAARSLKRPRVLLAILLAGSAWLATVLNAEWRPWPLFLLADLCFVGAGAMAVGAGLALRARRTAMRGAQHG